MSHFLRSFMGAGNRPWLNTDKGEWLYTLQLTQVENPLDPDSLWEAQYGGDKEMIELQSGSSSRRLKQALDAHRRFVAEKNDFQFETEVMQVFSDVVVWIPEKVWNSSSREGGERLHLMSGKLKHRHREDFEGELFRNREPRYSIMPRKSLQEHEVLIQFGLGVYLPNENDRQVANVSLLQQGKEPSSLPNWIFFEDKKEIQRPAALYEDQHYFLISSSIHESAIQSPLWIENPEQGLAGYLMINTEKDPQKVYGDDQFISAEEPSMSGGMTLCSFHQTDNSENQLQLGIQRVQQVDMGNTQDAKPYFSGETVIDGSEGNPLSGLTSIGIDETPDFLYYLTVTGIILPRMQIPGLGHWQIHLNEAGMPAEQDEAVKYQMRGNHSDELEWREKDSDTWNTLTQDTILPFPDTEQFTLKAPILDDRQYAILPLPRHLAYPLTGKKIIVGRDMPEHEHNADLALNLLTHDESIKWRIPPSRNLVLENIGTSAHHIQAQIKGNKLHVQQLSQSAPSYVLKNGVVQQTLAAKSMASADLAVDDELMMGHYLMQFQVVFTHDEKA